MAEPSIQIQIVSDVLVPFSMVFMGAFLGAGFAYLNERKKKKKERKIADIGAVLETTLCLHMMWNDMHNYREKFINPVRSEEIRFITMRPTIEIEDKHEIPWPRLVFLMENSPDLLAEISIVQSKFRQFREFVKFRSEQHMREVLPKLETVTNIEFTEEFMRKFLGRHLFLSMKNYTEEIIQCADSLLEDFSPLLEKLRKATKELYYDVDIPTFEPSESDTIDEPNSSG